jgi:hypothetical protein
VPTKIYILSCVHISFKINISLIQTTLCPPPLHRPNSASGGRPYSLGTSALNVENNRRHVVIDINEVLSPLSRLSLLGVYLAGLYRCLGLVLMKRGRGGSVCNLHFILPSSGGSEESHEVPVVWVQCSELSVFRFTRCRTELL